MNLVLLSGGSGTRLWPLSNDVRSKQFLKIFRTGDGKHESMVQRMYRMINEVDPSSKITIATSQNQVASIRNQLGEDVGISIEPCRRDTFPAIVLAAAYLHDVMNVDEKESVVVCPVDPLVERGYFETLKKLSNAAGEANLTLMGIEPTYPSEKYGYIITDGTSDVKGFKEKPDVATAEEYIKQGALWNGGVFAFKLGYLLDKAKEILGTNDYNELFENYANLTKISFDYAVAEKESSIKVIKYSGEWKDLGTWNTLTEAMTEETSGNVILGENCENVHVVNELSLPIVALGLKDVAIAATPDGILVSDKGASSYLKQYVPNQRPMYEKRQWGEYKVLDYKVSVDGENCLTKELVVLPGKNLSYQKHNHRTEMWTFVKGEGILILDGVPQKVTRGDIAYIKPQMMHAIKATTELHIIEVQVGDELTEEDIERFEYDWSNI